MSDTFAHGGTHDSNHEQPIINTHHEESSGHKKESSRTRSIP